MTDPDSGSLTVQEPRAAQALLDPRTARILAEFWHEPTGVATAAERLGAPLDALLYRVRRLEAAGLLRCVGTRARGGRPIRLYSTAAPAFFVPFDVTPYATLEAYLAEADREVNRLVQRGVARALEQLEARWGLRVAPGPDGHVHSKLAHVAGANWTMTPDGPPLLSFVYPALQLDFRDAKALQAELMEVFQRYAAHQGRDTYLCRIVLCPLSGALEVT